MGWVPYAIVTALLLAAADLLVKVAAGRISNSVALLLYGGCTFLVGLGWVLWQRARQAPLFAQPLGIGAAVGVGLAFAAVTLGLYVTYSAGAPISVASPVIRLGGLLLAGVVGLALLGEPLTLRYAVGVLLAVGGIYFILTR